MRIKRFLLFLMILFLASFWWAGGTSILSVLSEKKTNLAPRVTQFAEVELPAGEVNVTGIGQRLYRIVALKTAVQSKLNTESYVPLADIPIAMQQAIISVEDNRFYQHIGLDIEGILRATLVNMQAGAIAEGGSTITQQLVKNIFLSHDQTMGRKVEEALLSLDMELRYSKEEILEMYLNSIYFGSGAYGIGPAAQIYFGKQPADLNLAEIAMLAGLPNAPSLNSPYVDFGAAKKRQAIVLGSMVKNAYIGPSTAEEAKLTPITLAKE
ncbi:putative membrane protein [Propionispora sp. 2/2-37]|uniref:transglycosylase domain-containing protein n=1 Tax=Propionispora sp. 2/2-37 TaxID=1677858 RepID=UPI0006BB6DAD|nr:biosynthetic peptidoglycan transglycosylase [Propionispora sp. 2/2-37]CUH95186.1 putative membrane protein [Propionispora sp. 2/2-37]